MPTGRVARSVDGTLLGVAALVTAAAFTDSAYLNLGGGDGDDGIGGSKNTFDIQVVDTDPATNAPLAGTYADADAAGLWQQATTLWCWVQLRH